jgi:uncharacterized protein (DUF885 family)
MLVSHQGAHEMSGLTAVVQLEQLRQKIEAARDRAAGKAEFLEFAAADPDQRSQAFHSLALDHTREAEMLVELRDRIATLRQQDPDAIEEWVAIHVQLCERLLHDDDDARDPHDAELRRDLLRRLEAQWRTIARGAIECVLVHKQLLADYRKAMAQWLARPAPAGRSVVH